MYIYILYVICRHWPSLEREVRPWQRLNGAATSLAEINDPTAANSPDAHLCLIHMNPSPLNIPYPIRRINATESDVVEIVLGLGEPLNFALRLNTRPDSRITYILYLGGVTHEGWKSIQPGFNSR